MFLKVDDIVELYSGEVVVIDRIMNGHDYPYGVKNGCVHFSVNRDRIKRSLSVYEVLKLLNKSRGF